MYEVKERTVGLLDERTVLSVDMTRERFIELVEDCLDYFPNLRDELLPVAQTMPRYPLDDWINSERGCGCVVGEYLIATSELSRLQLAENQRKFGCSGETVMGLMRNRPNYHDLRDFGIGINNNIVAEIGRGDIDSVEIIDEGGKYVSNDTK